ncbi:sensor histidine kinase [Collibacillus ludicampi]|jgi:two-component sensor histidine kinase|uniref:histidine kinase n=1 Tax=Collibacillus ludicampi TaxID=2771369 RepID=A0AAV4LIB0_9BACL|nr:sensor histidine kinase [Collibacillus ludicampi]GIM47493.1 sensor histidine kinase [Collibacillus ludicampi]
MENMSQIYDLCHTYTSLSKEDIRLIVDKSHMLQTIADLAQANVFIDCPQRDGETMIVVAEAVPATIHSLYKTAVVGKKIYEPYEPAVFRAYRTGKPTMAHRAITHEGQHVKQNVIPIKNQSGKTIGLLILEQDVTLQVKRENELAILSETTEEFYRTFWDFITKERIIPDILEEALVFLDQDGSILYANNYAIGLIEGYGQLKTDNYINYRIQEALPFVKDSDYSHDGFVQREVNYLEKIFILRSICLKRKNDDTSRILINLRDITDLRYKERQLMVKSAVIKEIHHRVKNNLQTVASLLRLQMRRGASEEAKLSYQESLNRIMSIATVHEVLSYSGIEKVHMDEIINKISKLISYNFPGQESDVQIKLETEPIPLDSHQAVSLALILTELIQNCLKHAFTGREAGRITVRYYHMEGMIHLLVEDDGVGIKEVPKTDQLGLGIVKNLTHYDLAGTFTIEQNVMQGTTAHVIFPLKEEE